MVYVNAAYYPSWKVYKGHVPSQLEVKSLTHIFYAFARANDDGSVKFLDEFADTEKPVDSEKGCLAALLRLKRQNPQIKTLLSIGGGSGSANFASFAATPEGRANFARTAREFIERFSLDGVDIDWEHPKTPSQGQDFIKLLRATRAALPAPTFQLATALPVGEYCLKNINLREAGQEIDFLNLMAYDFSGAWTDFAGHQAQLFQPRGDIHPSLRKSAHGGVNYVVSHGFPAEKIVLGIPAYARFFPGANKPGQSFSNGGELDYEEIPYDWIEDARVDATAGTACYVDKEKGFVSFDVPATVQLKAGYVKQQGLAGLFYWTATGDAKGPNGLIASGYRALNGNPEELM